MGAAADAAKANSKFLKLTKGEQVVMEFISYQILPSNLDPEKTKIQVKLRTRTGDVKYWESGNGDTMMFFDTLPQGALILIHRDKFLTKAKDPVTQAFIEDPAKSSWKVSLAPQS